MSRTILLPAALLLLCGCNKDDARRLAEVGKHLGKRTAALAWSTPRMQEKWPKGWGELPPEVRVRLRLRWDEHLAEVPVNVESAGPSTIKLTGSMTASQRRRVVQIAESTLGVEKALDEMTTIPGP